MRHKTTVGLRISVLRAAMFLFSALIAGCSGGGNSLGGAAQNGAFFSAFNTGQSQVGTLALRTFANNSVTGTLTVVLASDLGSIQNAALPPGTYNVTGTRNGNSFTANGSFNGAQAANFTITGNLPTSTANSGWTSTITVNGQPYTFGGHFQVTGSPNTGSANFSFSNIQNSNADTRILRNTVNGGKVDFLDQGFGSYFTSGPQSDKIRTLGVNISSQAPIAVGDTIPVQVLSPGTQASAQIYYSEDAPVAKSWGAGSGTVKITAITGNLVTLQLINVQMQAGQFARPGVPNQGTGSFTINGTGSALIRQLIPVQ